MIDTTETPVRTDSRKHAINHDVTHIKTPVNADRLEELLVESNYDKEETEFLVRGFTEGFDLCYEGPKGRTDTAKNIPIREVGSMEEMWDKLMKEVELGRYAGPFEEIPFEEYIQSPIGLVPKARNKTRLLFHLSHDFKQSGFKSVNSSIPKHLCSVKYNDLDTTVKFCFKKLKSGGRTAGRVLFFGKTDFSSAFRMIPLKKELWKYLVIQAVDPVMGIKQFFFDKCLPFGASISCAIFQRFSNALRHILEYKLKMINVVVNYLDDYLFIAFS